MISDFSSETMQGRREWSEVFKIYYFKAPIKNSVSSKHFSFKRLPQTKTACLSLVYLLCRKCSKFFREKEMIKVRNSYQHKARKSIIERINKGKTFFKFFLYLIGLTDNNLFKIIMAILYSVMIA